MCVPLNTRNGMCKGTVAGRLKRTGRKKELGNIEISLFWFPQAPVTTNYFGSDYMVVLPYLQFAFHSFSYPQSNMV